MPGKFTRWFRRSFHRMGCLNLMALALLITVWTSVQVAPILRVGDDMELFHGVAHALSRGGRVGHFQFRINGDDNATFLMWSHSDTREGVRDWFAQATPVEIWALRSGTDKFIVLSMESDLGAVDAAELVNRIKIVVISGLVIVLLGGWSLLWMLRQYWVWFRYGPWFSVRAPAHQSNTTR